MQQAAPACAACSHRPPAHPPTCHVQLLLHPLQDGCHPVLQPLGPHQVLQLALTLGLHHSAARHGGVAGNAGGWVRAVRRDAGDRRPPPGEAVRQPGGVGLHVAMVPSCGRCRGAASPGAALPPLIRPSLRASSCSPAPTRPPTSRVPFENTMPTPRVSSWPSSLQRHTGPWWWWWWWWCVCVWGGGGGRVTEAGLALARTGTRSVPHCFAFAADTVDVLSPLLLRRRRRHCSDATRRRCCRRRRCCAGAAAGVCSPSNLFLYQLHELFTLTAHARGGGQMRQGTAQEGGSGGRRGWAKGQGGTTAGVASRGQADHSTQRTGGLARADG